MDRTETSREFTIGNTTGPGKGLSRKNTYLFTQKFDVMPGDSQISEDEPMIYLWIKERGMEE